MSTASRFREAVERIDRAGIHLPSCIDRVEDDAEDIAAQHFDQIGRSNVSSVLVCREHGVDLSDCHKDEKTCTIAYPVAVHSDPTGESAAETSTARNLLAELDRKVNALEKLAHWFDDFTHDHSERKPRKANPVESRKAEQENRKVSRCAVCPAEKNVEAIAVTDAGVYPQPLPLCSWHRDWALKHKRQPNADEEATHQRGKKVTARVSQMDRLRAGLIGGKL